MIQTTKNQGFQPQNADHADHADHFESKNKQHDDHLRNDHTAVDTAKGDQVIIESDSIKTENENKNGVENKKDDQLRPKPASDINPRGDHHADHGGSNGVKKGDHRLDPSPATQQIEYGVILPEPVKALYISPLGGIKAMAEAIDKDSWRFTLILADSNQVVYTVEMKATTKKAAKKLKEIKDSWVESLLFRVHKIEGLEYRWIEGCKCIAVKPHYNPSSVAFVFECPDGSQVQKLAKNSDEFEVMERKF